MLKIIKRMWIKALGAATIIAFAVQMFIMTSMTYNIHIAEFDRSNFALRIYYKYAAFIIESWADDNDKVILHINSPGGSVMMGLPIIQALIESEARTVGRITGGAYSMGAMVAIFTDKIIAGNYTEIMFHKARIFDKSTNSYKIVDSDVIDTILIYKAGKYLTEKELQYVLLGGDLFIKGPIFMDRFNKVNKGEN